MQIREEVRTDKPSVTSTRFPHFASLCAVVVLIATCFGQAPTTTANPVPTAPSSKAPGYLDPLPQDTGADGLAQALRRLQTTGRLMQVVAHPDDEDGGMLTLESRGKGVQTLLMTLTRGEGGQNKLGSSLFDVLGVLRTLELLASDRYYGVEQRFSRVADFGYSKTADETFQKWGGHDVALADIVRVIREFRPDVLVARFSGTENDGHGHHQASAILTREAFRAAADPNRFPEQLKQGLQPWQAKKLYIGNVCGFGAMTCPAENYTVKLNTGQMDPALGMSYVQFAMEGLRHQLSQGAGAWSVDPGDRFTFYRLVDSVLPKTTDKDEHEKDFFDGIDTTAGQDITGLVNQAQAAVGTETDSAVQPTAELVNTLHRTVARLLRNLKNTERSREETFNSVNSVYPNRTSNKLEEAELALQLALSLSAQASTIAQVSPGQDFTITVHLRNGSRHKISLDDVLVDPGNSNLGSDTSNNAHLQPTTVLPGADYTSTFRWRVPEHYPYTRPYWYRSDPERQSLNIVENEQYATLPFSTNPFRVLISYSSPEVSVVRDQSGKPSSASPLRGWLRIPIRISSADDSNGSSQVTLAVLPAFSVALEPGEQIVPVSDGKETAVKVGVSSNSVGELAGGLHLDLPAGWRTEPETLKVSLPKRGNKQDFDFKVFPANLKEGRAEIRAVLDAGAKYSEGYTLVTRQDLGSFYYYQPAVQHVSIVDVKVPKDLKVGYIMGAGDDIPTVLQQVGMNMTLIPAEKLSTENLAQYGSIVLGVRTYDTQKDVVANNQKLLDFVSNGGTLVVQNNNSVSDFNKGKFTPYPAELSRARVSVEEAPVQILAPENAIFHYPNEISQKDFDGWVQERGLYFMSSWDDRFTPLLSCHDPNESDQKGGLLVAKYGKGTYIYTGYAFFRQLPAGVPGAIRLFVNLVSTGK